ncbi:MAG: M23 family metallopeptidase [Lachnospiraceae bacterium]
MQIPDNGNGYGNYIMINHGGGRVTLYAHMSSFAISGGASVSQGQGHRLCRSTAIHRPPTSTSRGPRLARPPTRKQ